jgi:uncharacterized membrane protein YhaH (DUF805 family)
MQWYLKALRQYVDFDGRSGRAEYWMFVLFNVGITLMLMIIDAALGTPLHLIYLLATLLPSWALGARRLHDIGRSGWWQLLSVIPIVGAIILIVWLATEGHPDPNQWGANSEFVSGGTRVAH